MTDLINNTKFYRFVVAPLVVIYLLLGLLGIIDSTYFNFNILVIPLVLGLLISVRYNRLRKLQWGDIELPEASCYEASVEFRAMTRQEKAKYLLRSKFLLVIGIWLVLIYSAVILYYNQDQGMLNHSIGAQFLSSASLNKNLLRFLTVGFVIVMGVFSASTIYYIPRELYVMITGLLLSEKVHRTAIRVNLESFRKDYLRNLVPFMFSGMVIYIITGTVVVTFLQEVRQTLLLSEVSGRNFVISWTMLIYIAGNFLAFLGLKIFLNLSILLADQYKNVAYFQKVRDFMIDNWKLDIGLSLVGTVGILGLIALTQIFLSQYYFEITMVYQFIILMGYVAFLLSFNIFRNYTEKLQPATML